MVAVSGGVDSIVLCELLKATNHQFIIAHCNFKLRGEASDHDEQFVRNYAERLGVRLISTSFNTRDHAKAQGVSTQMAARTLRYEWFDQLMQEEGIKYLLTAHHKNDLAETMLLNMTRGTSINGLTGIPVAEKGRVRPLLSFTKSELLGYAINHQIKWREDVSNASTNYRRNKIRHEVVPVLEEINPAFLKQVERLVEKNKVVKRVFAQHIAELRASLIRAENGVIVIEKSALIKNSVSAFELEEILMPYGFNYDQCTEMLNSLDNQAGAKFESAEHVMFVDRTFLQLLPKRQVDLEEYRIGEQDTRVALHRGYSIERLRAEGLNIDTNPRNAMLDVERLQFPLVFRPWQQGDRFKPIGMKGWKLVSDLLIDEKVPLAQKKNVYVMLSKGEIAWVVGHRIAEEMKITSKTSQVLYFKQESAVQGHVE